MIRRALFKLAPRRALGSALALGIALCGPVLAADDPVAASPAPSPASALDAAAPRPITLQEALSQALAANPSLGSAEIEATAVKGQVRALLASVLPKVGVQGNYVINSEEASFGSGSDKRVVLPGRDWSYRLTLSQPVYAGNRERRALEQARLGIDIAHASAESVRDRLLLAVAADYLAVVRADQLIAVENQSVGLASARRDQAQTFFDAGETTRVDLLRAETDIKGAERQLAQARQTRALAESRLREDLALDVPLLPTEPGRILPKRPTEAELLAQVEASRPEVARAATAVEVARLEIRKQKGALLPVLTADGAWLKQRSSFPLDQYGFFALRLTVPVYQGGEVKARVAVANERLHQAELDLEAARRTVREEVRRAIADLAAADAELELAKEQKTAAEAEYQQADELYRAQELTALDARVAETSLAEARRAVATGELDRDLAELQVWAAAGLLAKNLSMEDVR